jgi:hypothetical protein
MDKANIFYQNTFKGTPSKEGDYLVISCLSGERCDDGEPNPENLYIQGVAHFDGENWVTDREIPENAWFISECELLKIWSQKGGFIPEPSHFESGDEEIF